MSVRIEMRKPRHSKRIILAEGHPWFFGIGPYYQMQMEASPMKSAAVPLDVPAGLWDADVPKYRLILERVDETD